MSIAKEVLVSLNLLGSKVVEEKEEGKKMGGGVTEMSAVVERKIDRARDVEVWTQVPVCNGMFFFFFFVMKFC